MAKKRDCQLIKLLIIDDDESMLRALKAFFERICQTFVAKCSSEAMKILQTHEIDIVLCDINLGSESGIILADEFKSAYPELTVCLMTSQIRGLYKNLDGSIPCIEKIKLFQRLMPAVFNSWLLEHLNKELSEKRESILQKLPYKSAIELLSRRQENGAEVMTSRLCRDDKPRLIRSVIYRHPSHPGLIDVGLAVGRGCRGHCKTCLTGKIRKYVTSLSSSEMIAQVLHAFDSCKAFECLDEEYNISVNFTCGDDFVFNPENVCEAIDKMAAVHELNASFVITTIGNNEVLRKYLPRLTDWPVKIYLSVHSFDQAKRRWLLPMTKNESLDETKKILSDFVSSVGQKWAPGGKWTLNWMLIKGFNDSDKDLEDIVDFCQGQPIEVKVMLASKRCLPGYAEKATMFEALSFVAELKHRGVAARFRENMGDDEETDEESSHWSCGETIPYSDYYIAEKSKLKGI